MRKKKTWILFYIVLSVCFLDCILTRKLFHNETMFLSMKQNSQIVSELKYFPLISEPGNAETCHYENSWGNSRTYGGNRRHEGTDLMTTENQRGIYPVISMTDGTLEQLGWLKLGGWRVGIRSASGVYYYYAHLESYAQDLTEGMSVKAGQFLGFAGDSGYGEEGTTGQFDVHLHVGIYILTETGDKAVNPYPYLKTLEKNKLYASYLP